MLFQFQVFAVRLSRYNYKTIRI